MLQDHFLKVKQALSEAVSQNTNPLRCAQLSTLYNNRPRSRTVVLRAIDDQLICNLYTDARSNKLESGTLQSQACMLFYDPKKLLQVRLDGYIQVLQDPAEVNRLFRQVPTKSLKDYTTTCAPGTPIDHPDHVSYQPSAQNHFTVLEFITQQLEFVQLKRPHHLRAMYKKEEEEWKGQWLVP